MGVPSSPALATTQAQAPLQDPKSQEVTQQSASHQQPAKESKQSHDKSDKESSVQRPQHPQQPQQDKTSYKKNVKYSDLVVSEVFTGGVKNNPTEEPVWRYVDNEQQIQGPWTSKQMVSWYKQGYFELDLLVVGCERKLCPPNLPKKEEYLPLGRLLQDKATTLPGNHVHSQAKGSNRNNHSNSNNYRGRGSYNK